MKIMLIGDPHVKKDNIEESDRLMAWILEEALITKVDFVMFLGDQYNDFASIRVEVMTFWREWLDKFSVAGITTLAIDGNHDMSTDCAYSAMKAHQGQVRCTDRGPLNFAANLWMLPFYRNNDDFLNALNEISSKGVNATVFCHQEVDGAVFENGFYAPHGVKIEDIPADITLISGHIHKKQEFGPIWYPGTARYLTRSDAGEAKGIHIFEPYLNEREFIPTPADVAEPFTSFKLQEGEEFDISLIKDGSRTYVDLKGSKKYIKKMLKTLPKNIIIRTFVEEDGVNLEIKESDGIAVSFNKYAKKFSDENDLTPDTEIALKKAVFDRCPTLKTQ